MSRSVRAAAAGTTVFFFAAPGVVAGVVPWLIGGWKVPDAIGGGQVAGTVLIVGGVAVVLIAFAQFVSEGQGTPAPVAPTERLVVGGLYRWNRNPMYLAVGAVIGGQALVFADLGVLLWLVFFVVAVVSFVRFYEQPTLRRRYGHSYATYCENVPGWYPRLTPWRKESTG